jgi:hypothetical protein
MSPVGLARFSTLRSWLSQWSYDGAHGDGVVCGRDLPIPAFVIEISGATRHYVGPGRRDVPRKAVGTLTDRFVRHEFESSE